MVDFEINHFNFKFFMMNETDKDLLFSESVKAGKRIYYFDVKQSRNGDKYIAITESKKIVDNSTEVPRFSFEKHKLFLYKEDYEKFSAALAKVIGIAKGNVVEDDYEGEDVEADGSVVGSTALQNEDIELNVDFE